MLASYKLDRVVAPLAHAADRWNPHGEKNQRFNAAGILGNACSIKNARRGRPGTRQHFDALIR